MGDSVLLVVPVMLPMVGAALALLARAQSRVSSGIGLGTAVLLFVASLVLLDRAMAGGALAVTVFGGWPRGMGLSVSASFPGVIFVSVTALILLAASIYSLADIGPRRRRAGYDALMLAMAGAINGAFLTDDLFNLYVWFELALLAALGLLTIDRRPSQVDGAIRYAAFGMLAATFVLVGVGMIYGIAGTLNIADATGILARRPPGFATAIAAALLLGGFMLKAGLVPFHLWLPASYHTAPTTVTAVFAGLLTKMGFYALLIVFAGMFAVGADGIGAAQLVPLFGPIAALTMLVCAAGALAQTDMRRVLAYHVIAQVGYMMMGLAVASPEGVAAAIFYMVHSIIVQANLFLGAGLIRRAGGSWDLTRAGGMLRRQPVFTVLFAVPLLSLAGIPPLSGFWAKLIVIRAAWNAGMIWLGVVAIVAGLMTIVSVSIFWSDSCWKEARSMRRRPIPHVSVAAMAILSAATVAIGLAPDWLWSLALLSARALGAGG